jgi:hypothetical protein
MRRMRIPRLRHRRSNAQHAVVEAAGQKKRRRPLRHLKFDVKKTPRRRMKHKMQEAKRRRIAWRLDQKKQKTNTFHNPSLHHAQALMTVVPRRHPEIQARRRRMKKRMMKAERSRTKKRR